MPLKLRHLEVFNAVFEAGSVSNAALRLNLTQPAVSIALGNLEEELGFRLFHRKRGFFAPTGEALQLRGEITQGLMALARVEQRADEVRRGWARGLSIATNGALSMNFLPRQITEFQTLHPGTHIELRVHSSRQIADWTASGQIDIGLIDTPVPVAGLKADIFSMFLQCCVTYLKCSSTELAVFRYRLHPCNPSRSASRSLRASGISSRRKPISAAVAVAVLNAAPISVASCDQPAEAAASQTCPV